MIVTVVQNRRPLAILTSAQETKTEHVHPQTRLDPMPSDRRGSRTDSADDATFARAEPWHARSRPRSPVPRRLSAAIALLGLFVAFDALALYGWRHGPAARAESAASTGSAALVGPSRVSRAAAVRKPLAAPVGIDVPSVGIHAGMVDLHLRADGSLAVPSDFGTAGWWADGTPPGAVGPAVVVGHVDSYKAAAVFYRLRDAKPGAEVMIRRADGSTARFVIEAVREYSKASLPAAVIYGPTRVAALRLITCGGKFDRLHRRYLDNVVVFATLASSGSASGRRT